MKRTLPAFIDNGLMHTHICQDVSYVLPKTHTGLVATQHTHNRRLSQHVRVVSLSCGVTGDLPIQDNPPAWSEILRGGLLIWADKRQMNRMAALGRRPAGCGALAANRLRPAHVRAPASCVRRPASSSIVVRAGAGAAVPSTDGEQHTASAYPLMRMCQDMVGPIAVSNVDL